MGHEPHVIAERWLQPQRLLHEHRDQFRILTKLILKVWMFSQDTDSIPEQAGCGFTACTEQACAG